VEGAILKGKAFPHIWRQSREEVPDKFFVSSHHKIRFGQEFLKKGNLAAGDSDDGGE
jgi:hypothetical protein